MGGGEGAVALGVNEVVEKWEKWEVGRPMEVSVVARVVGLRAYLADPSTFTTWRQGLGARWRKGMVLVCFDIRCDI